MGMRELEKQILNKAQTLLANPRLKLKDILEWSTGENALKNNLQAGESAFCLDSLGVWIAVKSDKDLRGT